MEPTREPTRVRMVAMLEADPNLSSRELGRRLGVSHIRVHELLTEMGYQYTATWRKPTKEQHIENEIEATRVRVDIQALANRLGPKPKPGPKPTRSD